MVSAPNPSSFSFGVRELRSGLLEPSDTCLTRSWIDRYQRFRHAIFNQPQIFMGSGEISFGLTWPNQSLVSPMWRRDEELIIIAVYLPIP